MRRALLVLSVLVALTTSAAAQQPAIVRHVLPNGLVVLVREDPAVGVVAASLLVRSGSAFETADTAGVTNFLQRAMLRGTKHHSTLALAEAAEELGGAVDASGDVDYAEVRATALARHWDALLALLAEVALEPTLPAGEIEKERALILGQLQTRAAQNFLADRLKPCFDFAGDRRADEGLGHLTPFDEHGGGGPIDVGKARHDGDDGAR